MRIMLDTNVILDVLLQREPFHEAGKRVMELAQYAEIEEYVSASAVTDIFYIAHRALRDVALVSDMLQRLFSFVGVVTVSAREIQGALDLAWDDFEDAVQYSAARSENMDAIITRDAQGYSQGAIPVYRPDEFWAMVMQTKRLSGT